MSRHFNLILLSLSLSCASGLLAQVDCNSCHGSDPGLAALKHGQNRVIHNNADNAIGVMDRGQLGNFSSNLGDMADFHLWNNEALHWPNEASDVIQYGFGLGLIVAQNGNVISSVGSIRDWTPAEGSLGTLFSGDLRASDDTPYLAHSHLPQTWPSEEWPGNWLEHYAFPNPSGNPNFPTAALPGEFVSDADCFGIFDDRENQNGSLGIEVRQSGFSYGRPYASDHVVWRSIIYNRSEVDLDSVYVGYTVVFRPDFDFVDRITMTSTSELGLEFGRDHDVIQVWDSNNTPDGVWAEERSPLGIPAFVMIESPVQMGVTDFHYFAGEQKPDTEELLWQVLSSRAEELDPERRAVYFHGDDPRLDDTDLSLQQSAYGEGARLNFLVMSGPFTLAAGDSVISSCAAVLGESGSQPDTPDFEDLHTNIADLWESYTRYRFAGPPPPPAPELSAATRDGRVQLWWNPLPSESAEDFQGYRLYRSDNYGQTWGQPLTDNRGQSVGYLPLARWDRADGISGRDPLGWLWLGNDSGLAYTYEDDSVLPGVEYWYCLKAYNNGQPPTADEDGLPSQENAFGTPDDRHVIAIVPHDLPAQFVYPTPADRLLSPEDGVLCDAVVRIEILDPQNLRDTEWELSFPPFAEGDSTGRFHLVDTAAGDTLFNNWPLPTTENPVLPVVAGFRLTLLDAEEGVHELGWNDSSPTTFDWWMDWRTGATNEYDEYVAGFDDFRVIIRDPSETIDMPNHAIFFGYVDPNPFLSPVPLKVELRRMDHTEWQDVSAFVNNEDLQLVFPDLPQLSDLGWDLIPGGLAGSRARTGWELYTDALLLKDSMDPDQGSQILIKTNNFDWNFNAEGDTTWGVAPVPADVFTVLTNKPLRPQVRYRFGTQVPYADQAATSGGPAVRTVPDPYIAGNQLEQGENSRRLLFTHLPGVCTIRIYTVAGDLVRELEQLDPQSDQLAWNLRNESRQHVAYGLYLFHVRSAGGQEQQGHFLVIR